MKTRILLVCSVIVLLLSVAQSLTLSQLRSQMVGDVIGPRDHGYNDLRTGYNARFSRLPVVIVSPANVSGVQLALEYARTNSLNVSIRSGAHSAALLSVLDEAVVIDFSNMKGIVIDANGLTAVVQPGMRWGEFYAATVPLGLGAPGGNCPGVGIGGSGLGGGANELSTKLGYSLDNIISMEVVLANGSIAVASATSHPDLFWALRGAGQAGYGVVSAFQMRLSKIEPKFYSAWITYAWKDFEAILNHVAKYAKTMPDEVNLFFTGWNSRNALSVGLSCFYNGPPSIGEKVCSTFINASNISPTSYEPTIESFDATVKRGTDPKGRRSSTKGGFLLDLSLQAVHAMRLALEEGPQSESAYNTARLNLYWHGGKMLGRERNAVAFVHRTYPWNAVWLASYVPESMTEEYSKWIHRTEERMSSFMSGETYNNYPDLDLKDWQKAYYAENYARLQTIKAAYDPTNLFRGPQTIEMMH